MLSLSIGLGLGSASGGAGADAWSPAELFASSEAGYWYDPSDLATLFQERTGASATTPATVGQQVGTILDKSGNANHGTAPSDLARPFLRQSGSLYYLEFDGANDRIQYDGTVLAGSQYMSALAFGQPELGFAFGGADSSTDSNWLVGWTSSTVLESEHWNRAFNPGSLTKSDPSVVTTLLNAAGRKLRLNGTEIASGGPSNTLVSFAGASLGWSNVSSSVTINFYGGILRAVETSDADAALVDAYLAAKAGN